MNAQTTFASNSSYNELRNASLRPELYRPYLNSAGKTVYSMKTGRMVKNSKGQYIPEVVGISGFDYLQATGGSSLPITNAMGLRKDQWIYLDSQVMQAARAKLTAYGDMRNLNTISLDGYSHTSYEYEVVSRSGEAFMDMDARTQGRDSAEQYNLRSSPLPITHADFSFGDRLNAVSKNRGGEGIEVTRARDAAEAVAEKIERTSIGLGPAFSYGSDPQYGNVGNKVYGYLNTPYKHLKDDITDPTSGGSWTPGTLIKEVLDMRQLAMDDNRSGPYVLYYSSDWEPYLDADYILTGGNVATQTLRERLEAIKGISKVVDLQFIPTDVHPFTLILVPLDPSVVSAINGMEITTIQWPSRGGTQQNFKVMGIQVPLIKADYYNTNGLVVGKPS